MLAAIARDNGAGLSGAAACSRCLCQSQRMGLTRPPVRIVDVFSKNIDGSLEFSKIIGDRLDICSFGQNESASVAAK